jgi:hypothetical protein
MASRLRLCSCSGRCTADAARACAATTAAAAASVWGGRQLLQLALDKRIAAARAGASSAVADGSAATASAADASVCTAV